MKGQLLNEVNFLIRSEILENNCKRLKIFFEGFWNLNNGSGRRMVEKKAHEEATFEREVFN